MNTVRRVGVSVGCAMVVLAVLASCAATQVRTLRLYRGGARPLSDVCVLEVPGEIQLLAVNGARGAVSTLARLDRRAVELHLPPGTYDIQVRYAAVLKVGRDDHETVESGPVMLELQAERGMRAVVRLDRPGNVRRARTFARNPKIWLDTK